MTTFEFRLHPIGTDVVASQVLYPLEVARDVLRFYRSLMASAPDEIQCYPFIIRVPPLDLFPEAFHNQVAIDLALAYVGKVPDADTALKPLRDLRSSFLHRHLS